MSPAAAFAEPADLLIGGGAVTAVEIPAEVLDPGGGGTPPARVELRPLTVRDVQLIARAAKEDEVLTSILMIQVALTAPKLTREQIGGMHSGLVAFLVERINHVSGLTAGEDALIELGESPVGRAFLTLAREFHWTPEQIRALTLGEMLGYLHMLSGREEVA